MLMNSETALGNISEKIRVKKISIDINHDTKRYK